MKSLLALIGLAVVLFASTNVDDIFVLVGFFTDRRLSTRDIVLGQYVGFTALFGVSVAASLLSLVIPFAYIGLLGVIPILIGGKKLFDLYRKRNGTDEDLEDRSEAGKGRAATVAMVTIANGGDNIGIYMPSFAIRSGREVAVIALVFAAMTALWCFAAYAMVNHPKLGSPIRRYGQRLSPILLIGLGVLILYQAGSFELFRHVW
ncbi:MAG: cadmium resistance transporter [Terracidiphilus sp.]